MLPQSGASTPPQLTPPAAAIMAKRKWGTHKNPPFDFCLGTSTRFRTTSTGESKRAVGRTLGVGLSRTLLSQDTSHLPS